MFNVFKRPMFRRGGSPTGTGIMSHVERRPNYSIGGKVTPRVNAKFGFGNFFKGGGDKYFSNPTKMNTRPSAGGPGIESIISQSMLEELAGGGNRNRIIPPRGSPYTGGVAFAAPIAAQTGLAYLNRPRSTEALKYMKQMNDSGYMDETAGINDFQDYAEELIKKDKQGKPISFTDAFLMNSETGTYPKFLGRTQDREIRKAVEEKEDLVTEGEKELFDSEEYRFGLRLKEQEKAKLNRELSEKLKKDPGKKDPKYVESDNRSSYEKEYDMLNKLIPGGISKAEKAFLIGKALSSPGSIADKIDIAGSEGMKLLKDKKQRDRAIAKLAYTGSVQKDIAKTSADKQNYQERLYNEMRKYKTVLSNPNASKENKAMAIKEITILKDVISTLNPNKNQKLMDPEKARLTMEKFEKKAFNLKNKPKGDPDYADDYVSYVAAIELLQQYPNLIPSIKRIDAQGIGILTENKKDGGRTGYALGTNPMEAAPEMAAMSTNKIKQEPNQGQVPTASTTELSFEEIRNRLPKEITDSIVKLISSSNEALQDFSFIRTQGDVDKFNIKYGVTLVLPAQT